MWVNSFTQAYECMDRFDCAHVQCFVWIVLHSFMFTFSPYPEDLMWGSVIAGSTAGGAMTEQWTCTEVYIMCAWEGWRLIMRDTRFLATFRCLLLDIFKVQLPKPEDTLWIVFFFSRTQGPLNGAQRGRTICKMLTGEVVPVANNSLLWLWLRHLRRSIMIQLRIYLLFPGLEFPVFLVALMVYDFSTMLLLVRW